MSARMSFWIVRVVTPNVRDSTGMVVARRATSMRMISALRSFIVTVDSPPFPWLWPYAITQTGSLFSGLRNSLEEISCWFR